MIILALKEAIEAANDLIKYIASRTILDNAFEIQGIVDSLIEYAF